MKDGPKNRLRSMDIHKIVDVFNKRFEIPNYSRMVSFEEIEKNEFNLNLPRYVDTFEPEEEISLEVASQELADAAKAATTALQALQTLLGVAGVIAK